MRHRNFLKYLYFLFTLIIFFPCVNAQNTVTELFSNIFGVPIDASFLILLTCLFLILFYTLQKGTQKVFGHTTLSNIIAFLICLVALLFMPDSLLTFLAEYTVFIIAIAFIVTPLLLINIIGIRSSRAKHFILILIYIGAMGVISKLSSTDTFEGFFELEFPFIFGDITIKSLAYLALTIATLVSLVIIIKEYKKSSYESNIKRLEERRLIVQTAKDEKERKKFIAETKKLERERERELSELLEKRRIKNIPIYRNK